MRFGAPVFAIVAALLVSYASGAEAQTVRPRPAPTDAQMTLFNNWAARTIAANKPLLDMFARCQPIILSIAKAHGNSEALAALHEPYRECLADSESAVLAIQRERRAIGPLPPSVAALFGIRPEEFDAATARINEAVLASIRAGNDLVEAGLANDQQRAQNAMKAVRGAQITVIDSSILGFELLRKSLGDHEPSAAILDMRIGGAKLRRSIAVAESDERGFQVGDELRNQAASLRATLTRLKANVVRRAAENRKVMQRAGDPQVTRMLQAVENAFNLMVTHSEALTVFVEGLPAGIISPPDFIRVESAVAEFEIGIYAAAASVAGNSFKN